MVLFISLGSVCAVSDVSESVNINEGILNSVDNNDTTHLQINELSDIANTCDNDSVDISNESNAESINNCVNDYNSESNAESNNNCDYDYESDYNVELNKDYNENINNLNVSSSESINENNISYNNSSNNYNSSQTVDNESVVNESIVNEPINNSELNIANQSIDAISNSSDSFTISQIMDAAETLKSYVLANQKLPSTVKINGKEISIAQFSYLMTIAIININAKNSSNIRCINISTANPFGDTINMNVLLKDYLVVAGNIATFIKNNNYMPNYATVSGFRAEFDLYTYAFAKILVFYKEEKYLPNYCLFDSGVFKSSSSSSSTSVTVTVAQVISSAINLKSYVLNYCVLPSTVTVNGVKYSTGQFAYLMSAAIQYLNAKKSTSTKITVKSVSVKSGSNYTVSKTLSLASCVSMAKTITNSVSKDGSVPAYVTVSGTKYDYRDYTYAFAKILAWYKNNKNVLPKTCAFESKVFKSSSSSSSSSSVKVTISQIITSSVNLKSYVLNYGVLPSTVTVNGVKYSTGQFAYLMSAAIQYLKAGKSVSTKVTVKSVSVQSGSNYTVSKTLSLASCVSMAKTITNSVSKNGYVPAYVTVSGTKYDYRDYTYAFAKILVWYKDNKKVLPKTCAFESKVFKSSSASSSSTVTVAQVIASSVNLKSYVLNYCVLPSTVTVNGVKYSTGQFAYLMSAAIQYLNAKKSTSTKITVKSVSVKSGSNYTVSKTLSLASCVSMAKTITNSVSKDGSVPAYVTVSGTKYDYRDYTYAFAKILAWYKNNKNVLPKTCAFESKVFKSSSSSGAISGITYKKGINEVGSASSSAYLASSGNAVITTAIKNLASSLTKNCKSDLDKATVLFNYVRDNIDYSYYYNTKYKASGTLTYKKGNCCDKSNLLVALCRASGLSSRYCHSTSCTFNSGLVCGHVWVQINVGGVWYAADTTSSRNTLGHINNWKTSSMGNLNQYSSLPF